MIKYYSTNDRSLKVSFKEAILSGLAKDKGLFMPEEFKKLNPEVYSQKNFSDMCYKVAQIMFDGEIPAQDLKMITDRVFIFDAPLRKLHDNIFVLELFHGPSAAFKDFAARFMAEVMGYYVRKEKKKLTILVATSGDTGSAVAKGFFLVPDIDVIILYPKGKVSILQEKQLTTLDENIISLEVKGTFDDCQRMVKEAFVDNELCSKVNLSSANSINIARLLPQSFYYIWAYIQAKSPEVIFCTPSGNFGNLTAGLIAKKMGLAVKKFIAATNVNDVVPEYLNTGIFNSRASVQTYSNAMDVGNPSNFARMIDIYKDVESMKKDIIGFKATDKETIETIKEVYGKYDYILDPHSAVGYKAVKDFLSSNKTDDTPIILHGTAHPAKFPEIIKKAIGIEIDLPEVLAQAMHKKKHSIEIKANFKSLKEYLLNRS